MSGKERFAKQLWDYAHYIITVFREFNPVICYWEFKDIDLSTDDEGVMSILHRSAESPKRETLRDGKAAG